MSEKCLDFDFFWFVFSRNQTEYVFSPNVTNYGTEKLSDYVVFNFFRVICFHHGNGNCLTWILRCSDGLHAFTASFQGSKINSGEIKPKIKPKT